MPNWVNNHLYLNGDPDQIRKLMDSVKYDQYGPGTIDFNKIIPMPEALNIESGSRTTDGLKKYKAFISVFTLFGTINMDKLLSPPVESEKVFLEQRSDIDPEVFQLGKQAYQNQLRYGAADWYGWCNTNWNTKWNACGYEEGHDYSQGDCIWFLTAWDRPTPIIEKLSEMFPDIEIKHEFANEDFGMECGSVTYLAGGITDEYYPIGDEETKSFALSVWGLEDEDCTMEMEDLT